MSSYEIDYSELSHREKVREAIKDTREYLGPERWQNLDALVGTSQIPNPSRLRFVCAMLLGVRGFPVEALIEHFFPEVNETGDYGEFEIKIVRVGT